MKTLSLVASAFAVGLLATTPSQAQDPSGNQQPSSPNSQTLPASPSVQKTPSTPSDPALHDTRTQPGNSQGSATFQNDRNMQNNQGTMSGSMGMPGAMGMYHSMSDSDKHKMRWVYYNLDEREVKRWRAAGYSEDEIKGAANIALRTGLNLDYVLRRVTISGSPLAEIASSFGLATTVIGEDIPGMGMASFSMMGSSAPMMNPGMSR